LNAVQYNSELTMNGLVSKYPESWANYCYGNC